MSSEIVYPLRKLLEQLQQLLSDLDERSYRSPIAVLSDASIGQHARHIIEFFMALDCGYETGYVNYDSRKRDKQIEADRAFGLEALNNVMNRLDKANKPLWLVTDFNPAAEASYRVETNYVRELVHNLEHVVHHMALMRIGVQAICKVKLPDNFGVAQSTMLHKKLSYHLR